MLEECETHYIEREHTICSTSITKDLIIELDANKHVCSGDDNNIFKKKNKKKIPDKVEGN